MNPAALALTLSLGCPYFPPVEAPRPPKVTWADHEMYRLVKPTGQYERAAYRDDRGIVWTLDSEFGFYTAISHKKAPAPAKDR